MKWAISQNLVERPRNITSLLNNFKYLGKQIYRKDALKNLTRKTIKMSI